jgi:surface antigen
MSNHDRRVLPGRLFLSEKSFCYYMAVFAKNLNLPSWRVKSVMAIMGRYSQSNPPTPINAQRGGRFLARWKPMMKMRRPTRTILIATAFMTTALTIVLPVNVYSEPPPWAPAHGWRKKNDPYYTGYSGKQWDTDYGVVEGKCNREAVGAVLGAVVGGAIGSQIGKGSGRQVAIVVGTVAGAVIGAQIGRDFDNTDRGCMGQALELAGDNRSVRWSNPGDGTAYLLTPVRGFQSAGRPCREFKLQTRHGDRTETGKGRACLRGDGTWEIVG